MRERFSMATMGCVMCDIAYAACGGRVNCVWDWSVA